MDSSLFQSIFCLASGPRSALTYRYGVRCVAEFDIVILCISSGLLVTLGYFYSKPCCSIDGE